jgi:DNA polymerase III gamma/tau subunit
MRILFANSRKRGRQSRKAADTGSDPLVQTIHRAIARSLKKVNWKKVWRIKKVSREEMMIEALQLLVRDFEEKMMVIFKQLVKESGDLKNEVRELQSTCEMLRSKKIMLEAENLKLKNGILHASEAMRDFLASIVAEANEAAAELKDAGQEAGGAVT